MSNLISNPIHQRKILQKLYLIRDLEEAIASRYSDGKMRCPTHLSIGQEGVPAALSPLLTFDDLAVSTHRAHAHYLSKGGCPDAMIAEIYGKQAGCSGGRGGSMHLIDERVGFKGSTAIVGNTIPIGVGLALSQKMQNQPNITVVFVGDGAIEEGVFYEAANFAVVQNLPVLFVCENNLYSVYSGLDTRQPRGRKIHELVAGMGMNTSYNDGNDVVSSYEMLTKNINAIKNGEGPRFIEFATYRWREHCGPNYDNNIGYRSEGEFLSWQKKEPIRRFETWLLSNSQMTAIDFSKIRDDVACIVHNAFELAESASFPPTSTVSNYVYR